MASGKKRLTQDQEFQIMKLVLDKFLWLGFVLMAFGMWQFFAMGMDALTTGITLIVTGAIVLILFMILIVKEYEVLR